MPERKFPRPPYQIHCEDRTKPILVSDADANDLAEFYHEECATVNQTFHQAWVAAMWLIEAGEKAIALTPKDKELGITVEMKIEGWYASGHSCGAEFPRLAWHTPSGCPKCNHSFVE